MLFVDDNHGNRAEAQAAVPGLQVTDEKAIAGFLTDPGFVGKPDLELTRLKQYKLLEMKQAEIMKAAGDNLQFLRQSKIAVEIIYDIEDHLDRAVELVNRTNQLNFTKRRLSDDKDIAAKELLAEIAPFHCKAGLVSVKDKYGDYGLCGFFLVSGLAAWGQPNLQHFAFSCRTLGMGVEQWVYQLLGRPRVEIVGEVLSDLLTDVDWINVAADGDGEEASGARFGEVRIRGGCELEVLEHFFRAASAKVVAEFIAMRGNYFIPRQNSACLAQSIKGLTEPQEDLIRSLGMDRTFFETTIFAACDPGTLIVYSPTGDATLPIFRDTITGLEVPVWFKDALQPHNPHRTEADRAVHEDMLGRLSSRCDLLPPLDVASFTDRYRTILSAFPKHAFLVVVLPNEVYSLGGVATKHDNQAALNKAFKSAAEGWENVEFVEMTALVHSIDEVAEGHLHFNRAVYRRLFDEIAARHQAWTTRWADEPRHKSSADDLIVCADW